MRIVSLLPSATEIICALGLRDQLVGVTHECDYPADVADLPKVTRTSIPHDAVSSEIDGLVRERLNTGRALYSLDMPLFASLHPNLIVTQSLCDVCAVAEREVESAVNSLQDRPTVVNLEPTCLAGVLECMHQVGMAADCPRAAQKCVESLKNRVDTVAARSALIAAHNRPRVMLLEWIDPPFSAGHWNPELVELAGGREVVGIAGERSVTVPWEKIVAADPEVLVITCCGFDVERTLQDLPILAGFPGWKSLSCVRSNRVYVADGSAYFSRPGPRLVDSLEILAHAIHPKLHPLPPGLPPAFAVPTGF